MISLSHNFLFVHVPKTAGNSIQNILREYSEDKIVCLAPHQDGFERFEVKSDKFNIHKHSTLRDYQAELGDELFQRLFKFATVRNPWERMISLFFSAGRGPAAWDRALFVKFVAQKPSLAEYVALGGNNSTPSRFGNMDSLIRYENLNDDFKKVCNLIGIPWVPLPIRNKSNRLHYASYYDDELVELVRNRFSEEIDYLGYKFEKAP